MTGYRPTYTEPEVRDAVENARSLAHALRRLGLRPVGGNYATLKKLIAFYDISTDHLEPGWAHRDPRIRRSVPLEQLLVQDSTYQRGKLKQRLYDEGIKARMCEMCGQDETWFGRPMSLILDHVNGVGDDNRLENLRIVCANCAATLDTHCGRKNTIHRTPQPCERCGTPFIAKRRSQRYCTRYCGMRSKGPRDPHPERRKVERPPYEQLLAEVAELGYSGTGRKYGVSDNAVRKWLRWYRARLGEARGGGRPESSESGRPEAA